MSLYGRGLAKRLKGDAASGDTDLKLAVSLNARVATVFAAYGLSP